MKARQKVLIGITAVMVVAGPCTFAQSKTTAPMGSNNLIFDTKPSDHARLREIFGKDHAAERVHHVRFDLSPGAVVPNSIRLAPLPETIINIEPTWQGNEYFKVGKRVVIVDPGSKKIEGVLTL